MLIFHSLPAAVLFILSLGAALFCRAGKVPLLTGLLVIMLETALTFFTLISIGSLHEALAYWMFPLFFMLSKESAQ